MIEGWIWDIERSKDGRPIPEGHNSLFPATETGLESADLLFGLNSIFPLFWPLADLFTKHGKAFAYAVM